MAVVAVTLAGCSGHARIVAPPGGGGGAADFVGAATCRACHPDVYTDVFDSGHPYKLNKVVGGTPPVYPYTVLPSPPAGWGWDQISWVIGGYSWKARFIDPDGYIITGSDVQYNFETGGWSAYHDGEAIGTKPYNCGKCHTTGWVETGAAGPHQDGQPGMHGTFSEGGITCEACHGPGSRHAASTNKADIEIDRSADQCGQCHTRDAQRRIEAKGGFIRHHEQYDEMISAKHAALDCIDCHHQHKGARNTPGVGIVRNCESCHPAQAAKVKHNGAPDCIDCHMPEAGKSAVASNEHNGDVMSHIFKVNSAAVDKSAMWYDADGKQFSNGFVTLDFACYSCHRDASGVGGGRSQRSIAELSAFATGMHN